MTPDVPDDTLIALLQAEEELLIRQKNITRSKATKILQTKVFLTERIKNWNLIAKKYKISEKFLKINTLGIKIDTVGFFKLDDEKGNTTCEKGENINAPSIQVWESFINFMKDWDMEDQIFFCEGVMNMQAVHYWSSTSFYAVERDMKGNIIEEFKDGFHSLVILNGSGTNGFQNIGMIVNERSVSRGLRLMAE